MIRGSQKSPSSSTARDDEDLIVKLLAGADDYVAVKPHDLPSGGPHPRGAAQSGGGGDESNRLRLKVGARPSTRPEGTAADIDGQALDLTRLEFDVLAHLGRQSRPGDQPEGTAARGLATHRQRARLTSIRHGCAAKPATMEIPRFLHVHRGVGIGAGGRRTPRGKPRPMYRRLIYSGLPCAPPL